MLKKTRLHGGRRLSFYQLAGIGLLGGLALPGSLRAQELLASDAQPNDFLGYSVSQSGDLGLAGAFGNDWNAFSAFDGGSAYLFGGLDTASGEITEDVQLRASDPEDDDHFGSAVSLSGANAIVGGVERFENGVAYVFHDIDTASGLITENVRLVASDNPRGFGYSSGSAFGKLDSSVSLSGSIALVGAHRDSLSSSDVNAQIGSAYVFRDVDTVSGTVSENIKLIASDGASDDRFGFAVSQSGSFALVGAIFGDSSTADTGSAYLFRDLDTSTGTIAENLKLVASDGASGDEFGSSLELSGASAIIGAGLDDDTAGNSGSAYLYRDLDTAIGTITENAKLVASDPEAGDQFASSVSLSNGVALVGALGDDDNGFGSGSAYLYKNLDTASGIVTENVKLTASSGVSGDNFGFSVSIDGDQFLIGAWGATAAESDSGKAYSGSVSSVTTLDEGSASRNIDGISFVSQDHWIVGENTDTNQVTLGAGDSGDVTATGKSVFIGRNAGSDANTLVIEGSLTATEVRIGSVAGNADNTLRVTATGSFDVAVFYLAQDNLLEIEGDFSTVGDLLAYLDDSALQVQNSGGTYETLTSENFDSLVATSFDGDFTTVSAVPEPGAFALLAGLSGLAVAALRRRGRG